jgi:uncharacterized protein (DUF2147 family)
MPATHYNGHPYEVVRLRNSRPKDTLPKDALLLGQRDCMKILVVRLLVVLILTSAAGAPSIAAGDPRGLWLVDGKAAVEIYDCNGLFCGRIRWLQEPIDAQGNPKRDKANPEVAQRRRPLCGLTVLSGLRAAQPGRWEDGSFYDPDSGKSYNVKTELTSSDRLVARFYKGIQILGETKTLTRISAGTSAGWC